MSRSATARCKTHPYIDDYLSKIKSGEIRSSEKLKLAADLIYKKLDNPDVFIDAEKIDKAVELIEKYFEIKLIDWELCVIALVHCYYESDDTVVFDEFFILMGRGNGKNGFISGLVWYLSTHYHGIKGYNIDIIANSEDQAKTSFDDIYEMLGEKWEKLKKFFYRSKEIITNLRTRSYIKYNTSTSKTKDGKRTACLVFDELHEYENWQRISVYQSGFGKRKHSRTFYITTNGYVREGVLDELIEMADRVLTGEVEDIGLLPLLYYLDDEKEVDDEENWIKANPSYPYFSTLRKEMRSDYKKMQYMPHKRQEFFTKRMNMPRSDSEQAVATMDQLIATRKELPDLTGRQCVLGIDFASANDLASTNLRFREGENRYDINHSWLCMQSADLPRIRFDWEQAAIDGYLTTIDAPQILPSMICDYIKEQQQRYDIIMIALDNYRFTVMAEKLEEIGFTRAAGNLWIVTPGDIKRHSAVVDYCFANELNHWGGNKLLRWSANNAKKVPTNDGGVRYEKIEGKSRKTDPFMAHVHSVVVEDRLSVNIGGVPEFKVFSY